MQQTLNQEQLAFLVHFTLFPSSLFYHLLNLEHLLRLFFTSQAELIKSAVRSAAQETVFDIWGDLSLCIYHFFRHSPYTTAL